MNTKTATKIGEYHIPSGGWHRLMILLLILSFVLVACGGNGGDGTDSGDTSDTQQQSGGDDYSTVPTTATDKGTIEIGQSITDEISNNDEVHSYQLTSVGSVNVRIRISAQGSAFTAPYVFLYGPDDALINSSNTSTSSRSSSFTNTLEEGTYTIVVRPVDGRGIEPYQVTVEEEE